MSKISTAGSDHQTLKFMTWNVDQSRRDQAFETTKWEIRSRYVTTGIRNISADLIHLQEMRHLENNPTPEAWLANLDEKYRFVLAYRNATSSAFGQATVYHKNRLFPLRTVQRWLSDTPTKPSDTWPDASGATGTGSVVLFVEFAFVERGLIVESAPSFWSVNVHFPMDETLKTRSCHLLLQLIHDITAGAPVILSGDFNFFHDGGRLGAEHRAIMESALTNITTRMITSQEGRAIVGTFVGYPHDAHFAQDTRNPDSQLDYIFTHNVTPEGEVVVQTETYRQESEIPELTQAYQLPSDHLAVVTDLVIN